MEKEKNNTFIIIILIVVVIIMAITIGYLLVSKNSNSSSNSNNETVNTESNKQVEEDDIVEETSYTPNCEQDKVLKVNVDTKKYTNIFDYISKQDNISIVYDYEWVPTENTVKTGTYNFSSDEVSKIIEEMKSSTIVQSDGGLGGAGTSETTIYYYRNGIQYYVKLYSILAIADSNDGNIYKIIDSNSNNIGTCYNYSINNFSQTLENKIDEVRK